MRYALRKQDKIASVYSEAYLKEHIISSLDSYFGKCAHHRICGKHGFHRFSLFFFREIRVFRVIRA